MLQAYHRSELHRIYSLAGFVDGSGRPPLMRAAVKVLQRPRNMGVGVCFESATPDARLVERVGALLAILDYRGIFDLEFIVHEGEYLLIDFNPRAYGQMAFEIARGLPSPYLHYLAAIGDDAAYAAAHALSAGRINAGNEAYCHGLLLSLMDAVQIADTARSGRQRERWGKWIKSRRSHLTDAVRQRGDFGPTVVDIARHCMEFLRRPRSFLHSLRRAKPGRRRSAGAAQPIAH
jgi:D-aspartate ligase